MTTATGDSLNYTYDPLHRLKNVATKSSSGTTLFTTAYAYKVRTNGNTTPLVEFRNVRKPDGTILEGKKYEYDALGNITGIYESTGSYRQLVAYTYDSQNQLLSETQYTYSGTSTTPATTNVYTYTYDTAGNILTEKKNGTVTKTYTYSNGDWKDLLVSFNDYAITYEGQTSAASVPTSGNPISYANGKALYSFDWVNGRRLQYALVDGADRCQVAYEYDADGIRTLKNVDSLIHTYITQNGKVVRETIGSGTSAKVLDFIYDESGRPFALVYTNGTATPDTYYYVLNLQGDVVKLVNASGTTVANYSYNAWGEILSVTDEEDEAITSSAHIANLNPLRYRGYYYDTETGFYYLQSRYYDPVTHRFINADSYATTDAADAISCNMFAYCGNNPINRVDYTGQFWNEIWEFAKTAVTEIGKTMGVMSPAYAGCGGVAVADGPFPFGDIVAIAGAALLTVGAIGYGIYQAAQTPASTIPKAKEKAEAIPKNQSTTVIYRYGGTNPGNLTPKEKDKYSGLSFSTIPMPGAAMTTIEALNATGVVYAVKDGATHVSVRPVGATMEEWINAGANSIWTQAVQSAVVKLVTVY